MSRPVNLARAGPREAVALPYRDEAATPILLLHREHQGLMARFEVAEGTDETARLYEVKRDVERRMSATPSTRAADLAAKVLTLPQLQDDTPETPDLITEREAFVTMVLA